MNQPIEGRHVKPWWEPVSLGVGQWWHCGIGSLSVYMQRQSDEWLLAWESFADTEERYRVTAGPVDALPEALVASRFVFRDAPKGFRLTPCLLDRPVVVKTSEPVMIPPGEKITFYISSPVCVAIGLLGVEKPLREVPALQLSDTWFGPNTREGELCYAARTNARIDKADVPVRPHRAVTPVTLHNRSEDMLSIEKLSIPVPFLAVYAQQDGTLWTDPVSLKHSGEGQLAVMEVGRKPAGATPLSPARTPAPKNNVVRAFFNLFTD